MKHALAVLAALAVLGTLATPAPGRLTYAACNKKQSPSARKACRKRVRLERSRPQPKPARTPVAPVVTATAAPSATAERQPPATPSPSPSPSPQPEFHALSVTAREWSLALSRPKLSLGLARIELNNKGEDGHDLVLAAPGGETLLHLPETEPGKVAVGSATLAGPGSYRLYCALPGHEESGMRAVLTVD